MQPIRANAAVYMLATDQGKTYHMIKQSTVQQDYNTPSDHLTE